MKILGIIGTNSENSPTRLLMQFIKKQYDEKAEIELVEIVQFHHH